MAEATVTAAGMRVIRLLVGQAPRTIGELIYEIGVTRTAVTEQLNELMAGGFVVRSVQRLTGRGRPRHRFSATPAALVLLFANNQQLLVPAIWKAIQEIGGEKLTRRIRRAVSRNLSKHYLAKITATEPKKRLDQFAHILEQEGGLIDLASKDGHVTITKRSCAFISMFESHRNVCEIDIELLSSVAGAPVRLIACRHDGAPCCQFEIDTRAVNGSR